MGTRISRVESLCGLVLSLAGLMLLLVALPQSPSMVLGGAARTLELTGIFRVLYLPMTLLAAANVFLNARHLVRPFRTPAVSVANIAVHLGVMAIMVLLLGSDGLVAARDGVAEPDIQRLVDTVNRGCQIGMSVVIVVKIVQIGLEIVAMKFHVAAAPSPR